MFIEHFTDLETAIQLDYTAWWQSGNSLMVSIFAQLFSDLPTSFRTGCLYRPICAIILHVAALGYCKEHPCGCAPRRHFYFRFDRAGRRSTSLPQSPYSGV
jgi:hypothetical protein